MLRPHGASALLVPLCLGFLAPGARAQVAPPGCGGLTTTTLTFSDATVVPIPDATSTATIGWGTTQTAMFVFGLDPYLWDIDLRLNLDHARSNDLKVYLASPSAHQITLTTDNNLFGHAGIFNGTLWDDSALEPVTDYAFVNGVPATAVVPEQSLGAFIGEDPNGIWTLTLRDDTPNNTGVLNGWSMDVTSLSGTPVGQNASWFQLANLVIPDGSPLGVASTVTVTGQPTFLLDVNASVAVQHTYNSELGIFLISPQGTMVTLTTRNGAQRDHVFNGTVFDDQAPSPATDYAYVTNVAAPWVCPDGALSALIGEDPNGVWTMFVRDDQLGDQGLFVAWSLDITTCVAPSPGNSICSGDAADNTHLPCPCGNFGAPGNGCAHSTSANGAHLQVSGATNPDSIVLAASSMPATAFGIYLQHDATGDQVFHDGILCASGNLLRLRSRSAIGGASSFPNSTDTTNVSTRGQVVPGSGAVRYYSTWYRNASTTFCPPATANVTNGWTLTW